MDVKKKIIRKKHFPPNMPDAHRNNSEEVKKGGKIRKTSFYKISRKKTFSDLPSTKAYFLSPEKMLKFLKRELSKKEEKEVFDILRKSQFERESMKGMKLLRENHTEEEILKFLTPDKQKIEELFKRLKGKKSPKDNELDFNEVESENGHSSDSYYEGVEFKETYHESDDRIIEKFAHEGTTFIKDFTIFIQQKRTLEEAFRFVGTTIKNLLNCRSVSIFLYSTNGKLERKCIVGYDKGYEPREEVFEIGEGFVGRALGGRHAYGRIFSCNEMQENPAISKNKTLQKCTSSHNKALHRQYGNNEKLKHLITVPLDSSTRSIGVIRVINKVDERTGRLAKGGFKPSDVRLLQFLSAQTANIINRLKQEKKQQVLTDIYPFIGNSKGDAFNKIAESIVNEPFLFSNCIIRKIDYKNQFLEIKGYSSDSMKSELPTIQVAEGVSGKVFHTGEHFIVKDFTKNLYGFIDKKWIKKHKFISMICLPIISNQGFTNHGTCLGTISIYTQFKFHFTEKNVQYLQQYASRVAEVIMAEQRETERAFLRRTTNALISSTDLEKIIINTNLELCEVTGFDRCCFLMKEEKHFRVISNNKHKKSWIKKIPLDAKLVKKVLELKGKAYRNADTRIDDIFEGLTYYKDRIKSLVAVPILDENGTVYGILILSLLVNKQVLKIEKQQAKVIKNVFLKLNEDLLFTISNLFSGAFKRKLDQEHLERMKDEQIEKGNLLRTLIDSYPDLIYIKDKNHKFQVINKAQAKALGTVSVGEAIGKTDFDFYKNEHAQKYLHFEKMLYSGETNEINQEEVVHSKKNGTLNILTTKVKYFDSQGNLAGLIGIGRDITRLKDNEKELKLTIELLNGIIRDLEGDSKNPSYKRARIAVANCFLVEQLLSYLSSESLKVNDTEEANLNTLFDDKFKNVLLDTPKIFESAGRVIFKNNKRSIPCHFNREHLQNIIITLVRNAVYHQKYQDKPSIYIETIGQYLYVKNTYDDVTKDINILNRTVYSKDYRNDSTMLFTIHKYFKDNYNQDIKISTEGGQFIVGLPLFAN